MVDAGTRLVAPVDLDPGRVEVQRHRTFRPAAELAVHAVRAGRERLLGGAQMRAAVAPRQLTRRRGRRHVGDRTQLRAGRIGAQALEIEHRVTAAEH
jgi:hypothetical protein